MLGVHSGKHIGQQRQMGTKPGLLKHGTLYVFAQTLVEPAGSIAPMLQANSNYFNYAVKITVWRILE